MMDDYTPSLVIISAVANNSVIGMEGKLPWHSKAELSLFKEMTNFSAIIMGRKTFESLGSKPLPSRLNIVITSKEMKDIPSTIFVRSLEEGIEVAEEYSFANDKKRFFVIGGSQVYKDALKYADFLIISRMNCEPEGDTYFPRIDPEEWTLGDITENFIYDGDEEVDFQIEYYVPIGQ